MDRITRDLPRILERHDAIAVGTRDAELRPAATMAVGVAFDCERRRVTVFVPEATSEDVLSNLRANGEVAAVFEEVLTHHTVQLKGKVVEMRPAADAERATVERCVPETEHLVHGLEDVLPIRRAAARPSGLVSARRRGPPVRAVRDERG